MLLLGAGHCFRDQVLEVCPEMARFSAPGGGTGMQRTFEGSSLETIRHMVASGIGLTVLPRASVADMRDPNGLLAYVPFSPPAVLGAALVPPPLLGAALPPVPPELHADRTRPRMAMANRAAALAGVKWTGLRGRWRRR